MLLRLLFVFCLLLATGAFFIPCWIAQPCIRFDATGFSKPFKPISTGLSSSSTSVEDVLPHNKQNDSIPNVGKSTHTTDSRARNRERRKARRAVLANPTLSGEESTPKRNALAAQGTPRPETENDGSVTWRTNTNENAPVYDITSRIWCDGDLEHHLEKLPDGYDHVRFLAFDDLFPGIGFGELFDENTEFREKLREAARADFFVPDEKLNAQANAQLKDPRSSLMSSWRRSRKAFLSSRSAALDTVSTADASSKSVVDSNNGEESIDITDVFYPHLSAVFVEFNLPITGSTFIGAFTDLCCSAPNTFGSWIDIRGSRITENSSSSRHSSSSNIHWQTQQQMQESARSTVAGKVRGGSDRPIPHSWHQDSGLDQITVMVGFPARDRYEGCGVFSHVVKLSHRLPPHAKQEPRLWADLDAFTGGDLSAAVVRGVESKDAPGLKAPSGSGAQQRESGPCETGITTQRGRSNTGTPPVSTAAGRIPEEYILRPSYRRGREVMVYNDRDVFHSAPDRTNRASVWRFM